MSIAYAFFDHVCYFIVTLFTLAKLFILPLGLWLFFWVGKLLGFTVEDE